MNKYHPIAVVEAKDNTHTVGFGMQQAMTYARMLDVPFAYSSNGDGFLEHDFLTGQERQIGMDAFPSQEELLGRYRQGVNGGKGLNAEESKLIDHPYYSSQSTYPPRYYQRNAVNRILDAIARGQNRILLVMATGTGKTYTAFQIVYSLLKSGVKKEVLYLADRNNLVDQSIQQDFAPLESLPTRSTLPGTGRTPSLLIRSILLSISSWSETKIRNTTASTLIRSILILSSSTSAIVVPPRRIAGGAKKSIFMLSESA